MISLLISLLGTASALVHVGVGTRRQTSLYAGFGASKKSGSQNFVKPGKKGIEQQWERYFQNSGSPGNEESSVWARAQDVDWLLVGSVSCKDGPPSFAFAKQKSLISWTAQEQHNPLRAQKKLEFGLGPVLEDDFLDAYDSRSSAPIENIQVFTSETKPSADFSIMNCGFKPYKSPLKEHQASLGSALLNRSTGKGSVKFKKAPNASDDTDDSNDKTATPTTATVEKEATLSSS